MDKQILEQYIDACELIKDTKDEIRKLRKHRSQIQQDSVKGSAHEFPYTLQTYHLEGIGYAAVKDPDELERMEKSTGGADPERREDQASGGSMAQYSFAQNAADYPVQGVRGI